MSNLYSFTANHATRLGFVPQPVAINQNFGTAYSCEFKAGAPRGQSG